MNYLFDMTISQPTTDTKFIGSGEYAITILLQVLKKISDKDKVFILYKKGAPLGKGVIAVCEEYDLTQIEYLSVSQMAHIIRTYDINTVFFPLQYPEYKDIRIPSEVKIISVLHDLAWIDEIEMPSHYGMELGLTKYVQCEFGQRLPAKKHQVKQYIEMFKKSLDLGDNQRVITVSNYSKSAIKKYIGIQDEKIEVLYSPPKTADLIDDEVYENKVLEDFGCSKEKYILLISASRWRKNVLRAIEALSIMFNAVGAKEEYKDLKVVVLGADEEHRNYFGKIVSPKDRFIIRDYVDKEELEVLYKHAGVFMYPSLLEGFGYPPMEAMKYGTVCACSKSMSIPEVCGDAAVYFNGFKRAEMIKAIITALEEKNREVLKKRSAKRYKEITEMQMRDLDTIVGYIIGD